ncbi:hypothetical protein FocTR4_00017124 [Fusarium oxysporum f. sp. cubense]|uniref:Uncharacterized protein n=1 Tax=Fusarium oxysporum f. sp. cubense TaxID=61366 RepID=A0A5C6SIY8_FUSOC|nr:hypothetical protein FocTR4_00017124 [Fusarium oxysporum f. sp. cubense]
MVLGKFESGGDGSLYRLTLPTVAVAFIGLGRGGKRIVLEVVGRLVAVALINNQFILERPHITGTEVIGPLSDLTLSNSIECQMGSRGYRGRLYGTSTVRSPDR